MKNKDQGVIDFLSQQLQRREEERKRLDDQLVRTYRANLRTLLTTWRFIVLTRAAFFALAAAGLQLILRNLREFLDVDRLTYIFTTLQGLPARVLEVARLLTVSEVSKLVALMIFMIVILEVVLDTVLAFLQRRCRILGMQAEMYLRITGLFSEIHVRRAWVGLPFWIARVALILFGIVALGYLGWTISD